MQLMEELNLWGKAAHTLSTELNINGSSQRAETHEDATKCYLTSLVHYLTRL